MDSLARSGMEADFGETFVAAIIEDGSAHVVTALHGFLADGDDDGKGRSTAPRSHRPALVADIAHFASILHGRHPGVVDHAAHKIVDDAARKWLISAIDGFAVERKFLNSLMVAAGPMHAQAGQENVTALLTQQAKSFEMLATSDRNGTPAGAAIAFVIDWMQTRPLLNRAALVLGMQPPWCDMPSADYCRELALNLGRSEGVRRAMHFGAEQLLAQQRGLWGLVAARHTELVARG